MTHHSNITRVSQIGSKIFLSPATVSHLLRTLALLSSSLTKPAAVATEPAAAAIVLPRQACRRHH
uniref:Uncharacterized protein n=1 Tax=Oryza sativa subsp. japonica TaxID=39947 RepID=Q6K6U1_ORYSJ|nr:hypothetical protein [Oryza sativa Japonica Group]BAD21955.1 hypothetical protein [Oryza sativa Japonica Group]